MIEIDVSKYLLKYFAEYADASGKIDLETLEMLHPGINDIVIKNIDYLLNKYLTQSVGRDLRLSKAKDDMERAMIKIDYLNTINSDKMFIV